MSLVAAVAAVMLVALIVYVLTGGADFGGGVWDLLASGPRKREQRALIAQALAPIWEANHVWLILLVVLMFVCFPPAFAAASTALHVPLTLMLIGVVLRGSAFVFRAYDPAIKDRTRGGWQRTFAIASAVTPVMLGVCLGAVSSGAMRMDPETGRINTDFVSEWLAAFPFAVGALTLCTCAMLAASYLTLEAEDPALQADFRRRALLSAAAVAAAAWVTLLLAREGAPALYAGLTQSGWALPFQLTVGATGAAAFAWMWRRHYRLARIAFAAQVALIIGGLGAAQYPYLIAGALTFEAAAAPDVVIKSVLITLGLGSLALLPAFVWLYSVFKRFKRSEA